VTLECGTSPFRVQLATGEHAQGRSIVIASGARYRRLSVDRLEQFEGISVHYWASSLEADLCSSEEVVLVGGGNSAGQAVVFLAAQARKVTLVARRPLTATMSQYLVERLEGLANVEIVIGAEVAALNGSDGKLDSVTLRESNSGATQSRKACQLFSFIGAEPNTAWLADCDLKLDRGGFVVTGAAAADGRHPLETSRAGVFAVGDVRSSSVKRVAASVGDGAQAVAALHAYLAQQAEPQAAAELTPATA